MRKKLLLSVAMLAVGAGLLIAAGFASPASSSPSSAGAAIKKGGILKYSKSIGITYIDPALAYFGDEWMLEWATCAKLMNYPDKAGKAGGVAYPEVATGLPRVTNNGKTYTFTLKRTYRFSNGARVTAASFKRAFDRGASGKMNSPAISYEHEVAGADAFNNGAGSGVSGVVARGNTLVVRLTRTAPDFATRMTMPFFCSIPANMAFDPNGVTNVPGAGPYYFKSYVPDRLIQLRRNKFYKGPRPHNIDGIDEKLNNASLEACRLQTTQGTLDYCVDGVPPETYAGIAKKYGISKNPGKVNSGQYQENAEVGFSYVAMNMQRPIWKGNVKLRKAVNYIINRKALIAQGGFHSGVPNSNILPFSMPGAPKGQPYPTGRPDVAKATSLAKGNTRGGNVVMYQGNRAPRPQRAAVIKANLAQIGLNVDVQLMSRATQKEKEGRRSEPFDITDEGWIADYIDPFSFIGALLQGNSIQETENVNVSYFNIPKYNNAINAAGRLSGPKRFTAFGKLDRTIMTANDAVPWAPYQNFVNRDFFSKHVGCYLYSGVFQHDIAALCRR
jgi:peptide/nickel transport system substrate-binding protein